MKGLIKFLSPFAPDQSGASGVLYGLGGLIVICDAGGCTGNICGFDEPRWFLRNQESKTAPSSIKDSDLREGKPKSLRLSKEASAQNPAEIDFLPNKSTPGIILSAGLRDMDAILGRDDQLIEKLKDAAEKLGSPFAALIGTPVPAVIGTDFPALRRMAERKCPLPVLGIPCTGTGLYDEGEEAAYLALFERFAKSPSGTFPEEPLASKNAANPLDEKTVVSESKDQLLSRPAHFSEEKTSASIQKGTPNSEAVVKGRLGVLGATPLNLSTAKPFERLSKALGTDNLLCFGTSGGLSAVGLAGTAEKNLVVAPSGLAAAKKLEALFGTPYEVTYPLLPETFPTIDRRPSNTKKAPAKDDASESYPFGDLDAHAAVHEASESVAPENDPSVNSDLASFHGTHALIVHQQVLANEARKRLFAAGCESVTVATFFNLEKELAAPSDLHLSEENELKDLLESGKYDLVAADRYLARCARNYNGRWIHLPHFAVSGECADLA